MSSANAYINIIKGNDLIHEIKTFLNTCDVFEHWYNNTLSEIIWAIDNDIYATQEFENNGKFAVIFRSNHMKVNHPTAINIDKILTNDRIALNFVKNWLMAEYVGSNRFKTLDQVMSDKNSKIIKINKTL